MSTVLRLQAAPAEHAELGLPPVPAIVTSLDVDLNGQRQRIDTTQPIWEVRQSADGGDVLKLDLTKLGATSSGFRFSRRATHLARLFLAERLQRKKGFTVRGDLEMLVRFRAWAADRAMKQGAPTT